MGKTSKWIRHLFLVGNTKDHKRDSTRGTTTDNPTTTPRERMRWSFRHSSVAGAPPPAATAAAAEAAAAAAEKRRSIGIQESAAVMIQSIFRGYLARKALSALRGLVKVQALVRGHLVRKQALATLRCMQALVTVQARARMHRIKSNGRDNFNNQRNHRISTQENRFRHTYNEMDKGMEENIKIVEMDYGDSRTNRYSNHSQTDHRFSTHLPKPDNRDVSPAALAMSAFTEMMTMTPRACSSHYDDIYSFTTPQSSPHCYSAISKPNEYSQCGATPFEYTFNPSYMANTQSSRAKARSQSAPKSRPDNTNGPFERQTSKRRPSIEGRNVPRALRMQRSSSQVGSTAQNYHCPWSVKLDKSNVSIKDSECGSTSTILTNTRYYRSHVGFEVNGNRL